LVFKGKYDYGAEGGRGLKGWRAGGLERSEERRVGKGCRVRGDGNL